MDGRFNKASTEYSISLGISNSDMLRAIGRAARLSNQVQFLFNCAKGVCLFRAVFAVVGQRDRVERKKKERLCRKAGLAQHRAPHERSAPLVAD